MSAYPSTMAPSTLTDLKQRVARREFSLSSKQGLVLRKCLERPDIVAFGSTRDISALCGASPATVTRLARVVGCESFLQFRHLFQKHIASAP